MNLGFTQQNKVSLKRRSSFKVVSVKLPHSMVNAQWGFTGLRKQTCNGDPTCGTLRHTSTFTTVEKSQHNPTWPRSYWLLKAARTLGLFICHCQVRRKSYDAMNLVLTQGQRTENVLRPMDSSRRISTKIRDNEVWTVISPYCLGGILELHTADESRSQTRLHSLGTRVIAHRMCSIATSPWWDRDKHKTFSDLVHTFEATLWQQLYDTWSLK